MDSDSDEICFETTPPEIKKAATNACNNLLPEKSRTKYETTYKKFMDWREQNGSGSFSENTIMAYFARISNDIKPSTLWSVYSMLRSTLSVKHNVDISEYHKLRIFLKRQSTGFKSKKSKTLTPKEINDFIKNAPDEKYLFNKVSTSKFFLNM